MEAEKIVFDLVDTISSPVCIVEQTDDKKYSQSYINKAMNKLLNHNMQKSSSEKKRDEDKDKPVDVKLPEAVQKLLLKYSQEAESDSHLMHDVEIFDRLYNVVFNKREKNVLVVFNENKLEDFFNNITFHDLSQSCNAIVVVLDDKGTVIDTNDCFLDLVGVKKEGALGKDFFESFVPGDKEKLDEYFQNILQHDEHHQHFVTPLKGKKTEAYRINWQISKIQKSNHTYVIAVGSDISKFINENSVLKKQLKSIKIGFEYFPFAVGYMNAKGHFTKVNPRFMKIFNIDKYDKDITFDKIPILKKSIDFNEMNELIKLIKEMSYKVDYKTEETTKQLKIDIRLLTGSKESSKFYIVVAQKI